jgi:urea transporter
VEDDKRTLQQISKGIIIARVVLISGERIGKYLLTAVCVGDDTIGIGYYN